MTRETKFWLVKAFEDYLTAKHEISFPENEIITTAVCFHSQQFIEKSLKSLLVYQGENIPKIHSLSVLKQLCLEKYPSLGKFDVSKLEVYSVGARYADDFFVPTIDEAKECFAIAEEFKKELLSIFGISFQEVLNWIKQYRNR